MSKKPKNGEWTIYYRNPGQYPGTAEEFKGELENAITTAQNVGTKSGNESVVIKDSAGCLWYYEYLASE